MDSKQEKLLRTRASELEKELAGKNRDLEIESSLERVRTMAMGMHTPDDLLSICKILFEELTALGFGELRNAMINIVNDEKGSFLNYDFKPGGGGSVTHFMYNSHPVMERQVEMTRSAGDAFFEHVLTGDDLEDFKAFRVRNGELPDTKLENISALYYYFYSIGVGSVGISAFSSLSEEKREVLKRFRNVFDLAYRRYADIELAEAQAKEARIETSLERVRAIAMIMSKAEELINVCEVMFNELAALGFSNIRNVQIAINNDERQTYLISEYADYGRISMQEAPYDSHRLLQEIELEVKRSKEALFQKEIQGKEFDDWRKWRKTISTFNDPRMDAASSVCFYLYSIGTGIIGISSYNPIAAEQVEVLKRFKNVFQLSYQRYVDVAQAEAQAREAQIELALERVRARTMAMYHSEELAETAAVLFEQLSELGNEPARISIGILDQEKDIVNFWATDQEGDQINISFKARIGEQTTVSKMYAGWKAKLKSLSIDLQGKELAEWVRFCREEMGIIIRDDLLKKRRVHTVGYFSQGWINYTTHDPLSAETIKVLERFSAVFDHTYTRFLDLQKAEAQAKEAQIELALERVRARTMAMQHSEELAETAFILFQQFKDLGENPDQATIGIVNEEEKVIEYWVTMYGSQINKVFKFPIDEPNVTHKIYKVWKAKKASLVIDLSGKELHDFAKFRESMGGAAFKPDEKRRVINVAFFSKGLINVQSSEERSDESIRLLERFAGVFDGTYTRFLDLQKAEAQAHEAQIELSLERVRAKTMAMHNSKDVGDTVAATFDELVKLGVDKTMRCGVGIIHSSKQFEVWTASTQKNGEVVLNIGTIDMTIHPLMAGLYPEWKAKKEQYTYLLEGEEVKNYYRAVNATKCYEIKYDIESLPSKQFHNAFIFPEGALYTFSPEPLTAEVSKIVKRFASVFGQTYRRYLDLQRAEAQARESQIELALERVRARTMAMQKSEELKEIIKVVYEQLVNLNILAEHAGFIMDYQANDNMNIWLADKHFDPSYVTVPYFDTPHWNSFNEAKKKGKDFFANHFTFEEKNKFYEALFKLVPGATDEAKEYYFSCPGLAISTVLLDNVGLYIENFSGIPYTDEENNTLMRFGKVFQQTYTRFLDLQKAEEQAREAQIELSLERVRAKTMAMHSSQDIADAMVTLFDELVKLGVDKNFRCGVNIFDNARAMGEVWTVSANSDENAALSKGRVDMTVHPLLANIYKAWKNKEQYALHELAGKDLKNYYKALIASPDYRFNLKLSELPKKQINSAFFFPEGALFAFSIEPLSEDAVKLFKRFAGVFGLTYRRFLDLQKAEAQAREAQVELSLERVRAKTMAMHTSEHVGETVAAMFDELVKLGIEKTVRCGISVIDEDQEMEVWRASYNPDGKVDMVIGRIDMTIHPLLKGVYKAWKNKETAYAYDLSGKDIKDYYRAINNSPKYPAQFEIGSLGSKQFHNAFFFPEGAIFVFSLEQLSENAVKLFKRFAGVFGLTYRRFLDLQKAEAQAREAQIEAALERVRSRTMGMQKSEELQEVIQLVYEQLHQLNFNIDVANFALNYKETDDLDLWLAAAGRRYATQIHIPYFDHPIFTRFNKAKEQGGLFTDTFSLEEKNIFFEHFFKHTPETPEERKAFVFDKPGFARSVAFMKNTALTISNYEGNPYSEAENNILLRFGKVFDQTYTRFNDLKQAEEQAKESQIQLALERVRARTMAMQRSEELAKTATVLFQQLYSLDVTPERVFIGVPDDRNRTIELWGTEQGGTGMSTRFEAHADGAYSMRQIFEGWEDKKTDMTVFLSGEHLDEHINYVANIMHMPVRMELVQDHRILYCTYFSKGMFVVVTPDVQSEETLSVLRRFAAVFDQTYTRFLDLQKAEAQAREAQVELSLERVRAKTMAMHTSEHVGETVATMFDELVKLGVEKTVRCGVLIIDETKHMEVWTAAYDADGKVNMLIGRIDMMIHPLISNIHEAWKNKEQVKTYELVGKDLKAYYRAISDSPEYPVQFDLASLPAKQTNNAFFFPEGAIFAFTLDPLSVDAVKLFKRFAGVFGLTYRRYLDLQKAEEQARESQIQLGLERVRAKAMSMQTSEELNELIGTVFGELTKLDFVLTRCLIMIFDPETKASRWWMANSEAPAEPMNYLVQNHKNPAYDAYLKAWKERNLKWNYALQGKVKRDWDDFLFANTELTQLPAPVIAGMKAPEQVLLSASFNNFGCLTLVSLEPLSDEHSDIMLRFANVFDMCYTRFNDLKLSEEQAREAHIEAALERVRAAAMAMHDSNDVGNATALVFSELYKLGITTIRCGVVIIEESTQLMEVWSATSPKEGKIDQGSGKLDMTTHPLWQNLFNTWKQKKSVFTYELAGQDLWDYYKAISSAPGYQAPELDPDYAIPDDISKARQYCNCFIFAEGGLFTFTLEPFSPKESQILEKFTAVFSLTYRRYLDLQQAEEQARESQIQLGLERVRARTMAMQKSEELAETAVVLFQQFGALGISPDRVFIGTFREDTEEMECWATDQGGNQISARFMGKLSQPSFGKMYKAWKSKKRSWTLVQTGKELADYINYLRDDLGVPVKVANIGDQRVQNVGFFSKGLIGITTPDIQPPETINLLERFAVVFDLTYTRFNDLKLAEEQAREAHIEASLERVRGKAMAMRNTNDLSVTASTVFTELRNLGINPIRSGVGLITKETRKAKIYSSTSSSTTANLSLMGEVTLSGHPAFEQQYKSWLKQENYFAALKGANLASYNKILSADLNADLEITGKDQREQYGHWFMFSEGFLYAWSGKTYTEAEIKILERFKKVIELTFRRYIELQKSEASARDALREASLDRVRAEIASMRSTEDLERITPLIWNELTILGIPFIRCGVFIIDEQAQVFHTHLSTADGKALATFNLQFDSEGIGRDVLPAWRKKQAATIHWSKEEFANYTKNLVEQGTVKSKERYVTEHPDTSLDLHFFPFLQGMLYAGNIAPLTDDEKDLVQSLADAFSTAYARYEDFNKLEAAKEQVEHTLTDLKATQTKLIQSEKMASLGELTAGIAHEIQNPLNFVNNFSEVNQEMIDELQEELRAGNIEGAMELAADIKQNEEKINHHGKRADGIVKGMLQHSRTGGGEKQPTNMNTLADEFLRLSYHGLRAKDKLFNSEMVTHFDPDLPKINVIPQDMGRVLLNLFNNAFYAVNQKLKTLGADYKPEVMVTTELAPPLGGGGLIIKVKDNGVGMPDAVKGKIMQPFFTTKPTGEGTGLGLSLTYDMVVKGHGGSIQVNSVEGEGSEFIITLPLT